MGPSVETLHMSGLGDAAVRQAYRVLGAPFESCSCVLHLVSPDATVEPDQRRCLPSGAAWYI